MGFGAVLAGATGFIGDLIAKKYEADLQGHENDRAREANRRENLESFERNKAFEFEKLGIDRANALTDWNRQNEYNSPAAQMLRLSAAGLNPNLMYGQGTTGNAAVISAPSLGEVNYEPAVRETVKRSVPSFFDSLGKYFAIRNADLEGRNLAAARSLLKWRTVTEEETARGLRRENELLEGTGTSSKDNFLIRHGGRLIRWLRSIDWDGSEDDVKKGRLVRPRTRGGD